MVSLYLAKEYVVGSLSKIQYALQLCCLFFFNIFSAAPPPSPPPAAAPPASNVPLPQVTNKKTHHPRLGLARVAAKSNDLAEAKKYYNEVIDISPDVRNKAINFCVFLV